ncbi:hypothetical protein ACHAPV_008202 [Trichoderma viride]
MDTSSKLIVAFDGELHYSVDFSSEIVLCDLQSFVKLIVAFVHKLHHGVDFGVEIVDFVSEILVSVSLLVVLDDDLESGEVSEQL